MLSTNGWITPALWAPELRETLSHGTRVIFATEQKDNACLQIFAWRNHSLLIVTRWNSVTWCFLMLLVCDVVTLTPHMRAKIVWWTCVPILISGSYISKETKSLLCVTYITYMFPFAPANRCAQF
jgi:hypothetical protein